MIKIYNRKTGEYEVEKVAGGGLLKSLYGNSAGKLGLELLVKRKFYSWLTGVLCDSSISAKKIKGFVKAFDIDMEQCPDSMESFKSFNEFFTRRLKPEVRPFSEEKELFLSPGDGRLKAWQGIDTGKLLQVKGSTYTLEELLGDKGLAKEYQGGSCILLRLAPVDYHRFHFVDSGSCSESRRIQGFYYSVNPVALNSIPQVFCRNKREYSIFHSDNFGDMVYMEVGATSVGSIVQLYKAGAPVVRGEEKGYFKFGGSTVILFLKKDAVSIDEEILLQTELGYETGVLAGEKIGRKAR